jgi:hypothetical protein
MVDGAESGPLEEACSNCGEPMLAAWGATCGRCKPKIAYPKTMMLAAGDLQGLQPLVLGWLAMIRAASDSQRGLLIELTDPVTVLTRSRSTQVPGKPVEIEDGFMSAGHAVLRRPTKIGIDPFTIEDRRDPGPSANGTFVNGRRLGPGEAAPLSDGDTIRVGVTQLQFKSLFLPPGSG